MEKQKKIQKRFFLLCHRKPQRKIYPLLHNLKKINLSDKMFVFVDKTRNIKCVPKNATL